MGPQNSHQQLRTSLLDCPVHERLELALLMPSLRATSVVVSAPSRVAVGPTFETGFQVRWQIWEQIVQPGQAEGVQVSDV